MKMCCKCHSAPRQENHNYCRPCQLAYNRERAKKMGGWWAMKTPEQKRRATVRHYILHRLYRGQESKQPCEKCGNPETEFHHLDYERMTRNVRHLCHDCHMEEERLKKSQLTDSAEKV